MMNTNATNFRKDAFHMIEQTVKHNEPLRINTKAGNAVLLSESDYNSMIETLYLTSIPGMREKLMDGMNEPLKDCLAEDAVEW